MKIVSLAKLPETTTSHNAAGKKRQMIAPGEIQHLLQFAQASLSPGEIVAEHKHADMYEVFLIEAGSGVIRVDGREYQIEKGTCITVEPDELHEVTNTGKEQLILTYFAIQV